MKIQICFYYDLHCRRLYCTLAVSATIRVILTKISNRSRIAVQWNGGFTELIEQTFDREGSLYLACKENCAFILLNNQMINVVVMSENV